MGGMTMRMSVVPFLGMFLIYGLIPGGLPLDVGPVPVERPIPVIGYAKYYAYLNFTAIPMQFVKVAGPYGKDRINGTRYFVEEVGNQSSDTLLYNGILLEDRIGAIRYSAYLNFTVPEEWSFIRVSGPYGDSKIHGVRYFVTDIKSGANYTVRIGIPQVQTKGIGTDYAWEVEGRQVFVDAVNTTANPKYVDLSIDGNIYTVTFDGTKTYNTSDDIDDLFAGTFVVKEPDSDNRATIVYVPEDSQVDLINDEEALGYARVHIPDVAADDSLDSDKNIEVHLHSSTSTVGEDEIQQLEGTLYEVQYDSDADRFMIYLNGTSDLDGNYILNDDARIMIYTTPLQYDFINTSLFRDGDGDGRIYRWYYVKIGEPEIKNLTPAYIPTQPILPHPLPDYWVVEGRTVLVAAVNASASPSYVDLFIDTLDHIYRVTFTGEAEYNVSEEIDELFKGTFLVKRPDSNNYATLLYISPEDSVIIREGAPVLGYHTASLYPEEGIIEVHLKSPVSVLRWWETENLEGTLYTVSYRLLRLELRLNGTRDLDGDHDYDDDADVRVIPGRWRYHTFYNTSLFYDTDGNGIIDFRTDGLLYNGIACRGSLVAIRDPQLQSESEGQK